jgi:CheY-like chemotaxis protein
MLVVGSALPTTLATAYSNDIDRARALNDGVVCYLSKPVNDEHLIRCLRAALRSSERPEENS